MNKELFEKSMRQARQERLSSDEKTAIRQSVLNFISQNPVRTKIDPRPSSWSTMFGYKLNLASTMAILLIITILVGGGAAVGAEKSLPGDVLYPVKVGVNEEVRGWFSVSEEAKGRWEVERAQRRLEEAEDLAAKGSLDTETRAVIESNFQAHSERVRDRIVKFENKENFNAAVDVSSNFEAALKAHQEILARLLEEETDIEIKSEIKPIGIKVNSEVRAAKKSREKNEVRVSEKMRMDIESSAEGKLGAAENKVEEVGKYISSAGDKISAETKAEAEAKLALAEKTIVEGRAKMEAKAFGDAFVLFQKAIRLAQEAKFTVEANQRFEVDVHINGETSGDDDNDFEIEGNSDLNIKNSIQEKTHLKADLGL